MPLTRIFAALIMTLLISVVALSKCLKRLDQTPADNFNDAQAVFRGRVTNVGFDWFGRLAAPVTFAVEESWKGVDSNQVVVYTGDPERYSFQSGETYLVYAFRSDGPLYTSACSETTLGTRATAAQLSDLSKRTPIAIAKAAPDITSKTVPVIVVTLLLLLTMGFAANRFRKRAA